MAQNLMSVAGAWARAAAAAASRALEVLTAAGWAAAVGTALSTRLCTVDFSMLVALVVRR